MKIFYADVIAGAVYERLKACRKHVTFIKFHAAREHETPQSLHPWEHADCEQRKEMEIVPLTDGNGFFLFFVKLVSN